jgi:hypothetical protein
MSIKKLAVPLLAVSLGIVFHPSAMADSIFVGARFDIYRAGGNVGTGTVDFNNPADYVFAGTPGLSFMFDVTGQATPCGGCPYYGPDGNLSAGVGGAAPTGQLGGITYNGTFSLPLLAVFLGDSLPLTAPTGLYFYTAPGNVGIGSDFTTLSPQLGQVFWIGDGLTGTGTGSPQVFYVPDGAHHLYFGVLDCDCYGDNLGGFTVDIHSQAPTAVPEPPAAVLLLLGCAVMTLKMKSLHRHHFIARQSIE